MLTTRECITASAGDVYALFGSDERAGWLFNAQYDTLAIGSAVTLELPLGSPGGPWVQILGRVTRLVPGQQIVIAHDLPWRGRLRVLFDSLSVGSTRVTVIAELDEGGVQWLLRRRGWSTIEPDDEREHRIGLLTSKSGPGSVFAVACENLASMAANELNADGGLRGRRVRVMVGDDATDPAVGVAEARRLLSAGCRVLIASVTSATFAAVERALRAETVPLIHAVLNEGGGGPAHVFRLGERPAGQLRATVSPFMKHNNSRHWFIVGNDYSWSHGAHLAAKRTIGRTPGVIVGERLLPLGTTDFAHIIEEIMRSGADLVLSSLVGADEVAFERQSLALGLRSRCRTLSLVLDESTRERIGDRASAGMWTAFGYFQQLATPDNAAFLSRYRDAFGAWAPPVSSLSESVYEAIHLYAAAARQCEDDAPSSVVPRLHRQRAVVPRGHVELDGPHVFSQEIRVAEATTGGFRLLDAHA